LGVFDSIFSEVTKWLLQKVDKKIDRASPSYRDRVLELYDCLCNIDEYLEGHHDDIFYFILNWMRDIPYEDISKSDLGHYYKGYKEDVSYSFERFDKAIVLLTSEIHQSLHLFNTISRRIILESDKEKQFWDDFISYLNWLDMSLSETAHLYWSSRDKNRDTKEDYFLLIKTAKQFIHILDNNKLLKKYIKEYKNYINMKWPPQTT